MSQVGWILYFVAVILSCTAAAGDDACPDSSASSSAVVKLKKQLLCNYDSTLFPVKHYKTIVNVTYNLFVQFFVFDEYTKTMEIHGWSSMEWNDEFLVWNPAENSGIDLMLLQRHEVWVPEIDINSPTRMGPDSSHAQDTHLKIAPNGTVKYMVPTIYLAHCYSDIRRWPFDSHNCTMKVTIPIDDVEQVYLTYKGSKVVRIGLESDNYWKFIESTARRIHGFGNFIGTQIVYTFVFERHSSFYVATVFLPSCVMILSTLTTFCLDPHGQARFFIISANIIAHCLYLLFLDWYLPLNGDITPAMITLTRDSFVVVIGSLLVTVCAARMKTAARAPPVWISAITDTIIETPGADYLLFTGLYAQIDTDDDGQTAAETFETLAASTAKLKWERLALLLDRTSLIVFSVVLAALSYTFLP